jgi:formate hydrogenlyase transcriptional activator
MGYESTIVGASASEQRADAQGHAPSGIQRILLDVSRATASHRDMHSLLRDVAGLLCDVARADQLRLVLHDPERNVMRLHIVAACEPARVTPLEMPVAESPAGVVWQTQQPLIIPSIERETRFAEVRKSLLADGMKSVCVLPLTSPLRRLGGLGFASRDEDAFSPADVEMLQQLTSRVALAVDNTLHHEAAQQAQRQLAQERDRLHLLLGVNNALVSNLEPHALFKAIFQCLRRVIAHDYTNLAIYDADGNAFDVWGLDPSGEGLTQERKPVDVDRCPASSAFVAGTPVRWGPEDLTHEGGEYHGPLHAEDVRSMCCVRLSIGEQRLGTLSMGRRTGERFTATDAELLTAVANQMAFSVANALAYQEIAELKDKLAAEKVYLQEEIRTQRNFADIIGDSAALKQVLHQVATVAPTDSAVLIRGETGTGKELIARAIHNLGGRRAETFVRINCAAIPSGLLESELFGHERGAFTGAIAQRIGRFELADGGTLFLDEVGDIPLELQPKLLRVLQEREFERLGSTHTRRVDVRLVAATNRNLEEMVAAGTFRTDLYYRINVFPIFVPPLRERSEDITALVHYFVHKLAARMKKRVESIPATALEALRAYPWPGNVRELENAIERAVILTSGTTLNSAPLMELKGLAPAAPSEDRTLEATEREAILRTLRDTNWVLGGPRGAAARLGLKRTTLQSRMRKLGISRAVA